jgi:hypothetical protein
MRRYTLYVTYKKEYIVTNSPQQGICPAHIQLFKILVEIFFHLIQIISLGCHTVVRQQPAFTGVPSVVQEQCAFTVVP